MGLIQRLQVVVDEASRRKAEEDLRAMGKRGAEGAAQEIQRTAPLFDKAWSSLKAGLAGIATGMVAAFSVRAIVDFATELYKLGANAGETTSKFTTVFGAASTKASAFLAGFANKAGLSTEAGQGFLSTMAAILQGMGATVPQSEHLGESLLGLAGDLSSFSNVPIGQSLGALRSALVGEFDPLKQFGIVLTAADVQQRALVMTGKSHVEQLTALDKAQAVVSLATERAGKAVGDLDRTQGSAVNTLRRTNAEWVDFKTKLGVALREAVNGSGALGTLGDVLKDLGGWFDRNRGTITAWIATAVTVTATGVKAMLALATNTKNELAVVIDAFTWFGRGLAHDWDELQVRFATAGQQLLGLLLKLEGAALHAAEAMGMTGVADRIRSELGRANATIGELGTFIATKSIEMRRDLGADDPSADRTDSLGGGLARNLGAGSDKGKGHFDDLAEHGAAAAAALAAAHKLAAEQAAAAQLEAARKAAEAWAAFVETFERSMGASVEAADRAGQDITAGLDRYLEAQTAAQDQADQQRLQSILNTVGQTNDAQDAARRRELEAELAANAMILQDATATQAQRRAAFERSADIQVELAALAARKTLEAGDVEAKSREAVEARKRQALVESGMTAAEVDATIAKDAATSAGETKNAWLRELNVLSGAIQGIGAVFGGVFQGIAGAAQSVVGGLNSIAAGIEQMTTKGKGLGGFLGQISGGIGAGGAVLGIINFIGGMFHRDKDPGRMRTNDEEAQKAAGGDQAALDHLYVLAGRTGTKGWATAAAREDAYQLYLEALARTPALHATGAETRNIAPYRFGGVVPTTGPIFAHAGEGVLNPEAMRLLSTDWVTHMNLSALQGVQGVPPVVPASMTSRADTREMYFTISLHGVADRDVPRRVVDTIKAEIGQDYQKYAALQGNVGMPA